MKMKKNALERERRRYIRLDSVFPVLFRIVDLSGKNVFSDWIQGFTHNVSNGGIRLDVNHLNPRMLELIKRKDLVLFLQIHMPLNKPGVSAQAKVAWLSNDPQIKDRYFIGVTYEKIEAASLVRIMRYARGKKMFLPIVLSIISVLVVGIVFNSYQNMQLIKGNRDLIQQLIKILQETKVAKDKIRQIDREREDLQLKMDALQLRIQTVEQEKTGLSEKAKTEEVKSAERIKELNNVIEKLNQEKNQLQEQLLSLRHKESAVTEELLQLDKKKVILQKANIDKMYRWLLVHQNPRTGLVLSFEGDNEIANWSFIYDQSLAVQNYTNFSDFERARKTLDFFRKKAKRQEGLFFNAYYANDGSVAEYTAHSGPNIWLGIAILQYTKKTQDARYLYLAEEIAQAIINLQNQDKEGGIRGGQNIEWYSTEHNLDGYAFFNMLYKITSKQIYLESRDKVLNWLVANTYDKVEVPIKRGKGDSTIATDTYAWSIAAIGPEKLTELGMNPDKIVEFAEDNCAVEVSFSRPDGQTLKCKGFDFAAQRHIARGGVISTEWTAQMIIAFRIMEKFYRTKEMIFKARGYEDKADDYLVQLCNLIISSPSPSGQGEGCLPYASTDFVDTGHGWMTPKGKSTGSVSATAYTIFAYYHYNPLEFSE